MKRYTWTLAVMIVLAASATSLGAQTKEKKNIFGMLAGGVSSRVTDHEGTTRFGVIGGLYWEYRISEKSSLISNILYSQRGEVGTTDSQDIKLAYLNMPIMIKYALTEDLGVSTGVNSDYLLTADGEGGDRSDFKKSEWGFPLGISYDLTSELQVGGIHNIGLSKINKRDVDLHDWKNNWGSIYLAYLF